MAFIHLHARLSLNFVFLLFHLKTSQRFNFLFIKVSFRLNTSSSNNKTTLILWMTAAPRATSQDGVTYMCATCFLSNTAEEKINDIINTPQAQSGVFAVHIEAALIPSAWLSWKSPGLRVLVSLWLTTFFFTSSQSVKESNQYLECHHLLSSYEPSVFMEPLCSGGDGAISALDLSSPPNPQDIPKHIMDVAELPSFFSGLKLPPE